MTVFKMQMTIAFHVPVNLSDNKNVENVSKSCHKIPLPSRKHTYIILTSLNPTLLGFTGVNIIFLISTQNIDCGYSLEPPRRGGSNVYPQSMFCAEI